MTATLLAAAAVAALAGCSNSPFDDTGGESGHRFFDSILAHNLADGSLLTRPSVLAVDQGVHEEVPAEAGGAAGGLAGGRQGLGAGAAGGKAGSGPAVIPPSHGVVKMSLRYAIEDAMAHNLSIKVRSYTPAVARAGVVAAKAFFDPALFGGVQYQHLDQPTPFPQTLGGASLIGVNGEDQVNSQVGLKDKLISGGELTLSGSDNYQDFRTSSGLPPDVNPSHTADFALSLKQPLLRGFGPDVAKEDIYISESNEAIARSIFRSEVIKIVAHVEETYLSLREVAAEIGYRTALIQRAKATLKRLSHRQGMDVDAVQLNQARAAVDSAEFELVAAQRQSAELSESLKALLNDSALPIGPGPALVPTGELYAEPIAFDLRQDIGEGLLFRGVMQRDRRAIEKAGIREKVARNALLPKADLVASTDTAGLAPDGSFPGAFNRAFASPHVGAAAGIQFEMPLGNRAAGAELARRQLLRQQALTRLLRDGTNVARDVASRLLDLTSDWRQIAVARRRRSSAAAVLKGLKVEELSGQRLTPTFLQLELNAQQDLAAAQIAQAQAEAQYEIDLVRFERAKGTLLEFRHIKIIGGE